MVAFIVNLSDKAKTNMLSILHKILKTLLIRNCKRSCIVFTGLFSFTSGFSDMSLFMHQDPKVKRFVNQTLIGNRRTTAKLFNPA